MNPNNPIPTLTIDPYKFCFIICSNDSTYMEECLYHISRLNIPDGYSIDALSIGDAQSMAQGYNEGMSATNAKYKIYLHHDVFILYPDFLLSILKIFQSDSSVGMIGMVGSPKLCVSGVMWHGRLLGGIYTTLPIKQEPDVYQYNLEDGLHEVEVIDGLMMITAYDLPWREDIFDQWDFYDVSQSIEFRKAGYKVVVPEQHYPWCFHDDQERGLNVGRYDTARRKCLQEYPEYFYPEKFTASIAPHFLNGTTEVWQPPCILLFIRNQFAFALRSIQLLTLLSEIKKEQIIIIDNGSEDGLHLWLKQQKEYSYLICNEVIEGLGTILNEIRKYTNPKRNFLLLTPEILPLPGSIDLLSTALADSNIGGISPRILTSSQTESSTLEAAMEYALQHRQSPKLKELSLPSANALMLSGKFLASDVCLEENLHLPEYVLRDYSLSCGKETSFYFELSNAFFYCLGDSKDAYRDYYDVTEEEKNFVKKWGQFPTEENHASRNP